MGNPTVALLIALLIFFLAGVPIMAIVAIVRSSRAERSVEGLPALIARIYSLEKRAEALEKKFEAHVFAGPAEKPAMPVPQADAISPGPSKAALAQPHQPEPSVATPSSALPSHVPAAPPVHPPTFSAPLSVPSGSRGETDDVESVIAGRWLNYVGILALALAASFFLKYAFDNNWIGPAGRVALGLIVGGALYPLGQWIYKKGYIFYSEGITALGAVILYLSIWAGWHYYHLFPPSYAFLMMIAITAVTATVSIVRDTERLAFLAALGGLMTPALVSTGQNAETVLFGYLLILGAGMLGLSFVKDWKTLPPLQFVATLIYFWSWYGEFYRNREMGETVVFATLFFILFAALPIIRSARQGELIGAEIAIVLSNATQFLIALREMLWPQDRWGLTYFVVGLAAVHLAAERAVPRNQTRASQLARTIYAGLALTFLTLTVPIRLEGKWITIAWAVEGAMFVWSGLRIRSQALRLAGLVLFVIVGIRLIAFPIPAELVFLLNSRFLTMASCAACFLAAFIFAARSDVEVDDAESKIYMGVGIAANLLFLIALSLDVWDLFGYTPMMGIDSSLAQQLSLSVLWLIYASVLMGAGVKWKSALVRWQSLLLLGAVVAKVFFFDLSFLTRFYRILSFFLLGLVLLAVSFLYQSRVRASSGGNRS